MARHNIDCVIDTNPMANQINTVSTHIKGTTAAVVSMKMAVIAAEKEAADHVCDNVNKGFYTLIHSQISQKIAKLQSDVDSHIMKLNQLCKQLTAIKTRMGRDYNMICSRYLKLFNGLNKNLQQRVYELDKPTVNFAVKEIGSLSNRPKLLTSTVPVAQSEALAISQRILASNMKNRGAAVIGSMSQFLNDLKQQKELTDRIMLKSSRVDNDKTIMVPVVFSESNYDKYGNTRTEVFVSQECLSQRSRDYVRNAMNSQVAEMNWEMEQIDQEVKSEFNKMLSASHLSDRVKEMANSLFLANNYQTIKQ